MSEMIIAVDPSLRGTGYALMDFRKGKPVCLGYDVIKISPKLTMSGCLVEIHKVLSDAISKYSPAAMAIEGVIFVQSYQTAITLGSARGAAVLAAAQRGLPIHEYAPRRVKQAVVGRGAAQKAQVGFMVRALLGLTETPPPDAADAIAIGLTHFNTAQGAALRKQPLPRI